MTIAAFDREDSLPIGATSQAKEGVRATIIALKRCITCWVTINAAWMHEDRVRFQKSCARFGVVLYFNRLCPNIDKGDADPDRKQECRSKQAAEPKRTVDSRCHVHMLLIINLDNPTLPLDQSCESRVQFSLKSNFKAR
jgi:hypothetical protein